MLKKLVLIFATIGLALGIVACEDTKDDEDILYLTSKIKTIEITDVIDNDFIELKQTIDDVDITWSSSNLEVIDLEGNVNRPKFGEPNIMVELEAKFKYKEEEISKKYQVIVKASAKETEINDNKWVEEGYNEDKLITNEIINEVISNLPVYKYEGPKIDFMNNWNQTGLFDSTGSQYLFDEEAKIVNNKLTVTDFGAIPNDPSFDNTNVIQTVIATAEEGDEIYFPAGKYYFKSRIQGPIYYKPHIYINKDNISIRGESKETTFIVSDFDQSFNEETPGSTSLLIKDVNNVEVSNIAFTSDFNDENLPEPGNTSVNNPIGNKDAPQYQIAIYGKNKETHNIVIDNVLVEYFQITGIRIHNSSKNQIINSLIQKASDIGGGGAGYAIEIRGQGHERFEFIDTEYDTYFNVVANVKIIGDYIRHGIILTYMAHNNFIFNNNVYNTGDDGIDLHGQDEFLNYLYNNISNNSFRGAGIGLGNYGNSSNKHDETGVGNVLYKNNLENNRYGVTIQYETFYTQVIENIFKDNRDGAVVEHNEVKHTNITDNVYTNNENRRIKNPRPKEW